jgi:hypothetical protein
MFCLKFRISNSHSCATCASTRKKVLGQYLQTREFGESSQNCLANVGQSGESSQKCLANVGESGDSLQNCLANVGESREYVSLRVLAKVHMITYVYLCTKNILYV